MFQWTLCCKYNKQNGILDIKGCKLLLFGVFFLRKYSFETEIISIGIFLPITG